MDVLCLLFLLGALGGCSGAPPECGKSESLSPHEDHCDQFYKCAGDGTPPSLEKCPPRWMYDVTTQNCTAPVDMPVDCSGRPNSDAAFKTFLRDPRPVCEPGAEGVQYHPHEYYCDRYYKCEDGKESMDACPDSLYFDADKSGVDNLVCSVDSFATAADFHCVERPLRRPVPGKCQEGQKGWSPGERCDQYRWCGGNSAQYYYCFHGTVFSSNETDVPRFFCQYPQDAEEPTCDAEPVPQVKCPQIWLHPWVEEVAGWFRYFLPFRVRQWAVYFWISWLAEPRATWGHCRYFHSCPVGEDGVRRPEPGGCDGGYVLDPYTLECVHADYVKGCKEYYHQAQWAAEYRRNLTYNYY